ncbi:MAG: hypothetical protein HPY67_13155 [Syntrophaceae bacterium]|nr:hypothetical protein [Syntrophaceae bacterium]
MGRIYRVPFNAVAVTAQQDLFEITAASNKPCRIHAWMVTQSSEVGDAQEEGLNLVLKRGNSSTTSGSGGTAPTPVPQNPNDSAAGFSAEVNNTTKMTGGTIVLEEPHNWNVRAPYLMVYTPETRPVILPGERKTLELATTPADSITMSGFMIVEEE